MFKINQVVFDTENKEFVKITNLRPALKADEFGEQGEMIPFEGVALRITQINKKTKKPIICFTYRKITANKLRETADSWSCFDDIINSDKPEHFEFLGRI